LEQQKLNHDIYLWIGDDCGVEKSGIVLLCLSYIINFVLFIIFEIACGAMQAINLRNFVGSNHTVIREVSIFCDNDFKEIILINLIK